MLTSDLQSITSTVKNRVRYALLPSVISLSPPTLPSARLGYYDLHQLVSVVGMLLLAINDLQLAAPTPVLLLRLLLGSCSCLRAALHNCPLLRMSLWQ